MLAASPFDFDPPDPTVGRIYAPDDLQYKLQKLND
jgi:hypothetical protein